MNLAFDPWIPCINQNGNPILASALQCCTDPTIADLSVRPHERVALMRFLLCVAYGALGIPKDYLAWKKCREHFIDACKNYLNHWKDSFELFHHKTPFLQVVNLSSESKKSKKDDEESGTTSTAKMDFALATGNNSTFFDHDALNDNRYICTEKLALNLLTFQMFSLGGRIGKAHWNGEPMYKKEEQKNASASSIDAPCSPGSMLHTFIRGSSLLETVWLNILSEDMLHDYKSVNKEDWRGRPIWEAFPESPTDEAKVYNATHTFIGRHVPLSRCILLNPDGKSMILGNGLSYPSFNTPQNPFPPEPSGTVVLKTVKEKKERVLLGVRTDKSLWRELHALIVRRHGDGIGGCLALSRISYETDSAVDIVVGGMARDQASVVDVIESVFHLPAPFLHEQGHALYAPEVNRAEKIHQALAFSIEKWRAVLDGGWALRLKLAGAKRSEECSKLWAQASRDYWTSVEQNLSLLWSTIDALGTDEVSDRLLAWKKMLRKSALDAYTTACRSDGERQMRAYVAGKRILLNLTKKYLEED